MSMAAARCCDKAHWRTCADAGSRDSSSHPPGGRPRTDACESVTRGGTSYLGAGYVRTMERRDHIISLIQQELEAYRRAGRAVHLAHAARALGELRARIVVSGLSNGGALRHVGASHHSD
jgi:hypothetical protein